MEGSIRRKVTFYVWWEIGKTVADRNNRPTPVKLYDVRLSANFCGFKIRPSVRSGELVNIRSTFMGHPVYIYTHGGMYFGKSPSLSLSAPTMENYSLNYSLTKFISLG